MQPTVYLIFFFGLNCKASNKRNSLVYGVKLNNIHDTKSCRKSSRSYLVAVTAFLLPAVHSTWVQTGIAPAEKNMIKLEFWMHVTLK